MGEGLERGWVGEGVVGDGVGRGWGRFLSCLDGHKLMVVPSTDTISY